MHFTPYFLYPFSVLHWLKINKKMIYIYCLFPTFFQYLSHSKNLINSWSSASKASLLFSYYFFSIRYKFYIQNILQNFICCMYIAMRLLYNYQSSRLFLRTGHIMPHFQPCSMISSYPYFLNEFINYFLELFSTLFNRSGWDLIVSSCFSIYQFTYCHLFGYIIGWFNRWFCSFYPHYPLFSTGTGCFIFQFKVLLIIFKPPSRNFSLWLTTLPSLSVISSLNPFLTLFISLLHCYFLLIILL